MSGREFHVLYQMSESVTGALPQPQLQPRFTGVQTRTGPLAAPC